MGCLTSQYSMSFVWSGSTSFPGQLYFFYVQVLDFSIFNLLFDGKVINSIMVNTTSDKRSS